MAVLSQSEKNNQAPARTESRAPAKKTLGFLNINAGTKAGNPIRVESVRLMEGNKTHEQIATYLDIKPADFPQLSPAEFDAEKARRLAVVIGQLEITFNPTRTEEESMLNLV